MSRPDPGRWLVDPAQSFYCEACHDAHPIVEHRNCREASTSGDTPPPPAPGRSLSPFRWFWANRVTKPCPDCGNRTSVGFGRHDPGAEDREPSECTGCVADKISNEVQFSRADPIPLPERGPCVICHGPARVYGPKGSPVCDGCKAEREPRTGPGFGQPVSVPGPRLPEVITPEPDYEPEFSLF